MSDRFRGIDDDPGWINRKLADLQRQLDQQRAARTLGAVALSVRADLDSTDLPSTFTTMLARNVTVPPGYNIATVQLAVTAGTTVAGTGSGNIGVQPVVGGVGGSALSQGKTGGGAVSIASMQARAFPVTGEFQLAVRAYNNDGPFVAGSGSVHLSATVVFTRQ